MKRILALTFVIIFLTLIGLQIVPLSRAAARTIVVPTDYSTIKEAIGNAADGDTIYVKKGTYQESNLVVNRAISLIGEDIESTIVTSQSSPFMLMINHSQVTISGVTLIASGTQKPNVSSIQYDKEIVGIQIEQSHDCIISGNKIKNSGTAIWVHSSSNNIIEANTILDNYYGIDITGSSTHNIIRKSDISSSQVGIRFTDIKVNNTIVCSNNITSAYTGLFYYFTRLNFVVGNYIAHNTDAIHFVGSYSNVLHHNNFVYNSRDISKDSSYHDIRVAESINFWDDKKEGNYWSAYAGTGDNGIGKSPYILNEFNQDNYPLLQTVDITKYASYSLTTLPYPTSTATIATSPSPSINPSPNIPELSLIVLPLLFIVLIAGALVLKNKSIIDK